MLSERDEKTGLNQRLGEMKTDKKGRYQTGLRIPEELGKQLADEAEYAGMSLNAYILMLIDYGWKIRQRYHHAPSQNQQYV